MTAVQWGAPRHEGIELVEVKQNAGLGGGGVMYSHATSAFNKHRRLTKHLQICSKKSATIIPKLK